MAMFRYPGFYPWDPCTGGVVLFNASSGNLIWNWQEIEDIGDYQMFLTESFCGLMYWAKDIGYYKLLVLDTHTGQEIYHTICWDYLYEREFVPGYEPRVFAKGNYFFAISNYEPTSDIRTGDGPSSTSLCVKVNPDNKTCSVRHLSSGLEPMLLVRSLMDQKEARKIGRPYNQPNRPPSNTLSIVPGKINFFGFASDGVVIGEVMFNYHAAKSEFLCSKTIFSIDLDIILEMYEPCAMFAGVSFPLGQNVLANSEHKGRYPEDHFIDYYPYYETPDDEDGKVEMTGIFEKLDGPNPRPKLYLFKRTVEFNYLIDRM